MEYLVQRDEKVIFNFFFVFFLFSKLNFLWDIRPAVIFWNDIKMLIMTTFYELWKYGHGR